MRVLQVVLSLLACGLVRVTSDGLTSHVDKSLADSLGPLLVNETALLVDRDQILQRVRANVPDTVPPNVTCEKITRCDKRNVCAVVCKHGSVAIDPWLKNALHIQRQLAYRRHFCNAQLPGTHNSAINLADVCWLH